MFKIAYAHCRAEFIHFRVCTYSADFFSTMLYQFCLEKNVDRDSLSEIKELLDRFEPVLESLKNGLEFFA